VKMSFRDLKGGAIELPAMKNPCPHLQASLLGDFWDRPELLVISKFEEARVVRGELHALGLGIVVALSLRRC